MTETYTYECSKCRKPLATEIDTGIKGTRFWDSLLRLSKSIVCKDCSKALEAIEEKKRQLEKQVEWRKLCPLQYQTTDPSLLPLPLKLEAVMRWSYQPRGLILHGETRTGKSRCAWKLAEREFLLGRSIAILGCDFGVQYGARMMASPINSLDWLETLFTVEVILMDDTLKLKLTDSAESALFMILNKRIENCKPTIVTLNDTGEALLQRMSQDRGPAFISRLREFCDQITF